MLYYTPNQFNINPRLFDDTAYLKIIKEIDDADIKDEKIKEILYAAALRFVKINYQAVADLWAHVSDEKKKQLEDAGLVIVDRGGKIGKALEELNDKF